MMKRMTLILAAQYLLFGGMGQASAGTVYDAAANFSINSNPNGVWSYGSSASLSGTFSAYTLNFSDASGIQGWGALAYLGGNPSVFDNPTASTITYGTLQLSPGELAFHPGPTGQVSIVRFTAPSDGTYALSSAFTVDDTHGPNAPDGVHVLLNGTSIFDSTVSGSFGTSVSSTGILTLNSGDTVDFAVDNGGSYAYNTTGLGATLSITPLPADSPEPTTLTLLGIGIIGMAGYGLRRRNWR